MSNNNHKRLFGAVNMGRYLFYYFDGLESGFCDNEFLPPIDTLFYISEPDGYAMYIHKDALNETQNYIVKNLNIVEKLSNGFDRDKKKFERLHENKQIDLQAATKIFNLGADYFIATLPWFYRSVEEDVKDSLDVSDDLFNDLTAPTNESSLLRRQLDYVNLLEKKKSGDLRQEDVREYVEKYYFFDASVNDGFNFLDLENLREKLGQDIDSYQEIQDDYESKKRNLQDRKEKRESFFAQNDIKHKLRKKVDLLSKLSWLRLEVRLHMQQPSESALHKVYNRYEDQFNFRLFIKPSELRGLVDSGKSSSDKLRHEVKKRKDKYVWKLEDCESEFLYEDEFSTFKSKNVPKTGEKISGTVVSGENKLKIEGKVAIIRQGEKDLQEKISNFPEGNILITNQTTPVFTPAIEKAKAVVADEGGIMSHAATICREMNVPCIVGTEHAARSITDDEKVVLDLKTGIVNTV